MDIKAIKKVAKLAHLKFEEQEYQEIKDEFQIILSSFEKIETIDTSGIKPLRTPCEISLDWREDEVANEETVEELLKNAPEVSGQLFKVPPVV